MSRQVPRGWWCSRERWHDGPCALRPVWWNWSRFARQTRRYPMVTRLGSRR